jgi:winged helix DNA-binding protein
VTVRRIGVAERRARLAARHHLAGPSAGTDPTAAADALVAVHATDPATVFLSIQARTTGVDVAAIESALYEERTLLRMLAMRRTMFVVPVEDAPILQTSSADAIAVQQRKRYLQLLAGLGDGDWLDDVAESAVKALLKRGEATGAELSTDEPRLRSKVTMAEGKSYGGTQNITSWVLLLLAAQGRIVRGRPRGSWLSTQWRWSPIDRWLPGGMAAPSADDARAALVRRWLQSYGPGTVADLRWWTGWSAAHVKRALESVGAVEVDLDGAAGVDLPSAEPPPAPEPAAALLPALDPTPMGWSARDWYLGPHAPALFDRSGNIGPTVWWDGHVVGGWAQRADGAVVHRLLEDVGRDAQQAIDAAAEALEAWIGPARVVPRFRTPLEKELTA